MTYPNAYYETMRTETAGSAKAIVEHVYRLAEPRSVIDMGCGVGIWLKAFQDKGVQDVMGLEGDWLDIKQSVIDPVSIRRWDLKRVYQPEKRFDLAISLEVGEHLPQLESDALVESLTLCAPLVMFGAAIPYQVGVDHVNEQWPSFWKERFERRGYLCVDAIRPVFWSNPDVKIWYKQNTFLYVHRDSLADYPSLAPYYRPDSNMIDAVHPDIFLRQVSYRHPLHVSYKDTLRYFPEATWQVIKRYMKR